MAGESAGVSNVVLGQLVDRFMKKEEEDADDDYWQESDAWIGAMVLVHPKKGSQPHLYEVPDGKMLKSDSPGPYVATITMSIDTFLRIFNSAMDGTVLCLGCRSEVRHNGDCSCCHAQVTSGES